MKISIVVNGDCTKRFMMNMAHQAFKLRAAEVRIVHEGEAEAIYLSGGIVELDPCYEAKELQRALDIEEVRAGFPIFVEKGYRFSLEYRDTE